ncbi:hypothetical protein EDD28_1856 [Salana multivorans]|uniref:Phosphate transport regulator n=1 Tax=Salana multivorans TaxID=120377 RepID=A0A3N2DBS6_9MICO|nr:DUF47 family protein [Salana multivorans]OJX97687.1 MAG: phosphate transport regulator [Micrococcales bacterium 73-15]ROR97259.1 hypothetical protein EDD28_1856 [Salana multivorans]
MRFSLTPREDRVLELLGALARHLPVAADLLAQLVGALPEDRPALAERLRAVEHDADEDARAALRRVTEVFVTPLEPADVYLLAAALDDCVDQLDEVGEHIVLYGVETLPPGVVRQAEVIQRCAELAVDAVDRLRSLHRLREPLAEITRLEDEGDALHRDLLRSVFDGSSPAGSDPIRVLALKEVVDELEDCIDSFQKVASALGTIALREG